MPYLYVKFGSYALRVGSAAGVPVSFIGQCVLVLFAHSSL